MSAVKPLLSSLLWDIYGKQQRRRDATSDRFQKYRSKFNADDPDMADMSSLRLFSCAADLEHLSVRKLIDICAILKVEIRLMGYFLERVLISRERNKRHQDVLCAFVDALLYVQYHNVHPKMRFSLSPPPSKSAASVIIASPSPTNMQQTTYAHNNNNKDPRASGARRDKVEIAPNAKSITAITTSSSSNYKSSIAAAGAPVPASVPSLTKEEAEEAASDYNQWLHAMKLVARLPGGMPPEFRRKLWLSLADKYLKSKNVNWTKEEEKCFCEKWREDDEELGIQIVKDLHRTGSNLCTGPAGTINQAKLKRILLGYARYNPEVGYCQGFNMLGALILQVMEKEEAESMKVMIYLVEGVLPPGYFHGSMGGLQADMAVFRELMQTKLPRLAKHLQKLQGPIENAYEPPLTNVFTMQWFLTMFCTCLPMTCVLRVWDLVLIEGSDVLLRTALVLWSLLEDRVLSIRTADDFYGKMGSFSSELLNGHLIDSNGLIEKVVQLGPIPDIQRLRDKHLYNIAPLRHKQGLQFYYDDEEPGSDEDSRLAVATVWGIPWGRRGSQGNTATATANASNTNNNNVATAASANKHATENKERLALDISLLKKQYDRLRERQRQAHIILTTACSTARQSTASATTTQPANPAPLSVNQLLLGRHAIVTNKGRRVGPPAGAIPPARKPSLPSVLHTPRLPAERQLRRGETLNWRDADISSKRRRESLTWKEIKADRASLLSADGADADVAPKSRKIRLSRIGRSDSSSYSEESEGGDPDGGGSSTDTSLCDEDDANSGADRTHSSSIENSPKRKSKLLRKNKELASKLAALNDPTPPRSGDGDSDKECERERPKSWAPSSHEIPFMLLAATDSPTQSGDEQKSARTQTRRFVDSSTLKEEEDSSTECDRLGYKATSALDWPDTTFSAIAGDLAITQHVPLHVDADDVLEFPVITSPSQLSPLPDIAAYLNGDPHVNPLPIPKSLFVDSTNSLGSGDDGEEGRKFAVSDDGVTNQYFERVNSVERPTKLDLLYSLNDDENGIRKEQERGKVKEGALGNLMTAEGAPKLAKQPSKDSDYLSGGHEVNDINSKFDQIDKISSSTRRMELLIDYSEKSSAAFIAEATTELSTSLRHGKTMNSVKTEELAYAAVRTKSYEDEELESSIPTIPRDDNIPGEASELFDETLPKLEQLKLSESAFVVRKPTATSSSACRKRRDPRRMTLTRSTTLDIEERYQALERRMNEEKFMADKAMLRREDITIGGEEIEEARVPTTKQLEKRLSAIEQQYSAKDGDDEDKKRFAESSQRREYSFDDTNTQKLINSSFTEQENILSKSYNENFKREEPSYLRDDRNFKDPDCTKDAERTYITDVVVSPEATKQQLPHAERNPNHIPSTTELEERFNALERQMSSNGLPSKKSIDLRRDESTSGGGKDNETPPNTPAENNRQGIEKGDSKSRLKSEIEQDKNSKREEGDDVEKPRLRKIPSTAELEDRFNALERRLSAQKSSPAKTKKEPPDEAENKNPACQKETTNEEQESTEKNESNEKSEYKEKQEEKANEKQKRKSTERVKSPAEQKVGKQKEKLEDTTEQDEKPNKEMRDLEQNIEQIKAEEADRKLKEHDKKSSKEKDNKVGEMETKTKQEEYKERESQSKKVDETKKAAKKSPPSTEELEKRFKALEKQMSTSSVESSKENKTGEKTEKAKDRDQAKKEGKEAEENEREQHEKHAKRQETEEQTKETQTKTGKRSQQSHETTTNRKSLTSFEEKCKQVNKELAKKAKDEPDASTKTEPKTAGQISNDEGKQATNEDAKHDKVEKIVKRDETPDTASTSSMNADQRRASEPPTTEDLEKRYETFKRRMSAKIAAEKAFGSTSKSNAFGAEETHEKAHEKENKEQTHEEQTLGKQADETVEIRRKSSEPPSTEDLESRFEALQRRTSEQKAYETVAKRQTNKKKQSMYQVVATKQKDGERKEETTEKEKRKSDEERTATKDTSVQAHLIPAAPPMPIDRGDAIEQPILNDEQHRALIEEFQRKIKVQPDGENLKPSDINPNRRILNERQRMLPFDGTSEAHANTAFFRSENYEPNWFGQQPPQKMVRRFSDLPSRADLENRLYYLEKQLMIKLYKQRSASDSEVASRRHFMDAKSQSADYDMTTPSTSMRAQQQQQKRAADDLEKRVLALEQQLIENSLKLLESVHAREQEKVAPIETATTTPPRRLSTDTIDATGRELVRYIGEVEEATGSVKPINISINIKMLMRREGDELEESRSQEKIPTAAELEKRLEVLEQQLKASRSRRESNVDHHRSADEEQELRKKSIGAAIEPVMMATGSKHERIAKEASEIEKAVEELLNGKSAITVKKDGGKKGAEEMEVESKSEAAITEKKDENRGNRSLDNDKFKKGDESKARKEGIASSDNERPDKGDESKVRKEIIASSDNQRPENGDESKVRKEISRNENGSKELEEIKVVPKKISNGAAKQTDKQDKSEKVDEKDNKSKEKRLEDEVSVKQKRSLEQKEMAEQTKKQEGDTKTKQDEEEAKKDKIDQEKQDTSDKVLNNTEAEKSANGLGETGAPTQTALEVGGGSADSNKKTLVLLLDNEPKAVKVRRLTRANTEELENLFQALEKQLSDRNLIQSDDGRLKRADETKTGETTEATEESKALSQLSKEIENFAKAEQAVEVKGNEAKNKKEGKSEKERKCEMERKDEKEEKAQQSKTPPPPPDDDDNYDWGLNPYKRHLKRRTAHLPSTKELESRFRSLERQINLLENVEKIDVEQRLHEIERKIKLQYSLSHEKDLHKFLELCEGKGLDELPEAITAARDRYQTEDASRTPPRTPTLKRGRSPYTSPSRAKEKTPYTSPARTPPARTPPPQTPPRTPPSMHDSRSPKRYVSPGRVRIQEDERAASKSPKRHSTLPCHQCRYEDPDIPTTEDLEYRFRALELPRSKSKESLRSKTKKAQTEKSLIHPIEMLLDPSSDEDAIPLTGELEHRIRMLQEKTKTPSPPKHCSRSRSRSPTIEELKNRKLAESQQQPRTPVHKLEKLVDSPTNKKELPTAEELEARVKKLEKEHIFDYKTQKSYQEFNRKLKNAVSPSLSFDESKAAKSCEQSPRRGGGETTRASTPKSALRDSAASSGGYDEHYHHHRSISPKAIRFRDEQEEEAEAEEAAIATEVVEMEEEEDDGDFYAGATYMPQQRTRSRIDTSADNLRRTALADSCTSLSSASAAAHVAEGVDELGSRLMRETSPLTRTGSHTGTPLRTQDNINDRLDSIKNSIKSIDSLCEEKPYRKERCQRYIDSLCSDSLHFASKKSSLENLSRSDSRILQRDYTPAIRISSDGYGQRQADYLYGSGGRTMGSAESIRSTSPSLRGGAVSPPQYHRSNRDIRREISPRRRREEEREEYESRVRRAHMMLNDLFYDDNNKAPSDKVVSSDSLIKFHKVDRQLDNDERDRLSSRSASRSPLISPYGSRETMMTTAAAAKERTKTISNKTEHEREQERNKKINSYDDLNAKYADDDYLELKYRYKQKTRQRQQTTKNYDLDLLDADTNDTNARSFDALKRSPTQSYTPGRLDTRHTTVTATFYDRKLAEKEIERKFSSRPPPTTFCRSPTLISPSTTSRSYVDLVGASGARSSYYSDKSPTATTTTASTASRAFAATGRDLADEGMMSSSYPGRTHHLHSQQQRAQLAYNELNFRTKTTFTDTYTTTATLISATTPSTPNAGMLSSSASTYTTTTTPFVTRRRLPRVTAPSPSHSSMLDLRIRNSSNCDNLLTVMQYNSLAPADLGYVSSTTITSSTASTTTPTQKRTGRALPALPTPTSTTTVTTTLPTTVMTATLIPTSTSTLHAATAALLPNGQHDIPDDDDEDNPFNLFANYRIALCANEALRYANIEPTIVTTVSSFSTTSITKTTTSSYQNIMSTGLEQLLKVKPTATTTAATNTTAPSTAAALNAAPPNAAALNAAPPNAAPSNAAPPNATASIAAPLSATASITTTTATATATTTTTTITTATAITANATMTYNFNNLTTPMNATTTTTTTMSNSYNFNNWTALTTTPAATDTTTMTNNYNFNQLPTLSTTPAAITTVPATTATTTMMMNGYNNMNNWTTPATTTTTVPTVPTATTTTMPTATATTTATNSYNFSNFLSLTKPTAPTTTTQATATATATTTTASSENILNFNISSFLGGSDKAPTASAAPAQAAAATTSAATNENMLSFNISSFLGSDKAAVATTTTTTTTTAANSENILNFKMPSFLGSDKSATAANNAAAPATTTTTGVNAENILNFKMPSFLGSDKSATAANAAPAAANQSESKIKIPSLGLFGKKFI